jgi:hypothetical protein
MLEFRLKPPNAFPIGRQPRLNRAHPLFNQQHNVATLVSIPGGMKDLVTGAIVTNTTTLYGVDRNAPYIWSNDSAGTATCSFTVTAVSQNWYNWGCIFMLGGTGRQYVAGCSGNTGLFTNGLSISFVAAGGTIVSFTGVAGHIYFAFLCNAVGTAAMNRTCTLVDLTTGQVFQSITASSGNLVINPVFGLGTSGAFTGNCRLYAHFFDGSILSPPAVNPYAHFLSIDKIMAGIADPWGLWYA